MAEIIITDSLREKISNKFKKESERIFNFIYSLKENPKKGKEIGCVGKTLIKELKYKNFRFYFITNGYMIKFLEVNKLQNLIIKFVRMSDKKTQQKTINEIKQILKKLGEEKL